MPWQAEQLHEGGVGGLEHAVVVGREQRDRHVVEQVLVAARGAHQVAMERVAFDRIRDDARQHAGIDAALLEVVLRAFAHGDQSLLVVVRPGEHDDGREVGDRAQRAQRFEAGGIGQPEIEQHQIVLHLLQACRGVTGRGLHHVAGDLVETGILQMPLDHAGIGRVVLD